MKILRISPRINALNWESSSSQKDHGNVLHSPLALSFGVIRGPAGTPMELDVAAGLG